VDAAALDSLGAAVLLPIGRRERLAAFLCLGEKRSGDIYTPTDLALLTALAGRAANELGRFDAAEIAQQARAMQEALRRYVPGPVAARVVSGKDLEMGEREISVLFVDLRGYTTYSEQRTAAETFSTVNRYTDAVSRVLRAHGGTVVEFNGDGMMAVFGAPEDLAQKEHAAVAAGREIIDAVRALDLADGGRLDAGVGIATGRAFVGNIRSADRWIWSAIGNTPNLAARLQALTRDLDAAVAVDTPTWLAAGAASAAFELRAQVPIRGRRRTEDVYVLPRATAA
jgi:adenylate cyclase